MEIVAILLLGAAVAWLGRRVGRLERELARLQTPPLARRAEPPAVTEAKPPAVEPAGQPKDVSATEPRTLPRLPAIDFETLFGRNLPIWAGGATLAVAGFFLVRWSIDRGLLTPAVRVLLAGLFGAGLIAGAEAAWRWRERVADPRVAQALAGAGLATLYAAFYLAGRGYGLVGAGAAFVGLALATGAAIALSYRFGLPSAVLALTGGFAAPAMTGGEEGNLPLLAIYLGLVTAALTATARRQRRDWLGPAAIAGGLGWGALLVSRGALGGIETVLLGGYLVLVAAILPVLLTPGANLSRMARVAAAFVGAVQLAALVATGGFGALEWGLYLLLGAALAGLGWREPAMREGHAAAGAVAVFLLAAWSDPAALAFAIVAAGLVAVFAVPSIARLYLGKGNERDAWLASGMSLGIGAAIYVHFAALLPEAPAPLTALGFAVLAFVPAAAAWFAPTGRQATLAAQAAAATLAYAALAQVLPYETLAWTAALLAAVTAWRLPSAAGALAAFAGFAVLWAAGPAEVWLAAGLRALAGYPLNAADLPGVRTIIVRIVPAAAAIGAWWMIAPRDWMPGRLLAPAGVALAAIALHAIYRHAFAAIAGSDFVATGTIERAVWEIILVSLGWAAMRRGLPIAARTLAVAALVHFLWFAATLHNPLWSAQAVGALPLVNALPVIYGAGLAALWLAKPTLPEHPAKGWLLDAATMAAIAVFALSLLRHAFSGSLLTAAPVGEREDLLRSLVGIALAAGFLVWGARARARSWRIGSLVVMLAAVLKVFIVDAAGLTGLARVASFMALGFSLIGIGWFYNRQLRGPAASASGPADPASGAL